jgi:hypothetical protein
LRGPIGWSEQNRFFFGGLIWAAISDPVVQKDPEVQDLTFKRLSVDLSLHGIFYI